MATSTLIRKAQTGEPTTNVGQFGTHDHSAPEAPLVDGVPVEAERPLSQRFDSLDEKLTAMREEIEKSVAALATDENWNNYLDMLTRFHNYSFGNQLLIAIQMPTATRCAGFNKWKELGRTVKKGERGISILAPKRGWVTKKDKDGKPVTGADGKPVKEKAVFGFTGATVFDVSQTEGEPLPSMQRELTEEPPEGFIEDLEAHIAAAGYTVTYEDNLGHASLFGATSAENKTVRIKGTLSAGSRAQVLAHELGHIIAGHGEEAEKYHTGLGGQRGRIETEAESISHVLLRLNGMKTPGDVTTSYIAGWATKQEDDPDVVKHAGEVVSKAVRSLVEAGGWRNLDAA